MKERKRVAIVYDWIDKWGGVERILLQLHEMFPSADFFTSYYDRQNAVWAKGLKIKTSFIQNLPEFIKKNRVLSVPFYPFAFESFDFAGYDLVISVTSSFAKAIITKQNTFHISYLLTPTRFLWIYPDLYIKNIPLKSITNSYFNHLKRWDYITAQRPDKIISISKTVADRCKQFYGRKTEVVYPPFDTEYWTNVKYQILNNKNKRLNISESQKYFLVVSRLEPYKRVDLVVDVFSRRPDLNLIIVGKGTEKNKLQKKTSKNIRFFEDLADQELAYLYQHAQALIMPQEEDFGYVALEAQFFGCPVIAYGRGGATETIKKDKTGIFFDKPNRKSLMLGLERFLSMSYNLRHTVKAIGEQQVSKFDKKSFINNLTANIKYKSILDI